MLGHSVKEDGTYPMINTGVTSDNGKTEKQITVPADFNPASEDMAGFSIEVTIPESKGNLGGQATRIYGPEKGAAPQMFLLEGSWQWPKERQNIEVAYPDFAKWNTDHNYLNWVKNSNSELIWQ